ncbi:SMI1/KNR4 family protein [Paenibacillus sp. A14]|uniref:SMI1/KNR4 family protein n=1 Tax=Paenibacillus sp. A14 TaxID=3119820 RepID=UPI002FE3402A
MREELIAQLEAWHEEDQFEEIVRAIGEVPAEERDYTLVSHLGRALNNLERYEEAVEQFLTVAEEGQEDPLWHYRIGLAYYYLERYEEALRAFEAADRLDPGDEDTQEFLGWIRDRLAEDASAEESAEVPAEESAAAMPDGGEERKPNEAAKPAAGLAAAGTGMAGFWDDSAEALEKYVSEPPTDDLVASVEEELVFRLPAYYVQMMKQHNGGVPRQRFFPVDPSESGAGRETVEIAGILGIGRTKKHSLCGEAGSRTLIEQGGYPEIGVVICDCPSAYEVVMLDYRESGNDREPEVVHVDKKENNRITRLAPDFETFIRGLANAEQA